MRFIRPWGTAAAVLILLLQPMAAEAGAIGDIGSKIDRSLSTFDPVGDYVRDPIEKAIPGLRFKGFFRHWSDALLNKDGQVGFRDQDYRYLQIQNLLELETSYHIGPGLDLNAVSHFLHDGVYDWQDSDGLFADELDRTAEYYHGTERILRELYLSYRTPGFDFLLGKQQVTWGKMDGQFIDVINAMDRRESVQLETEDYEWRRLPTWMANGTFHFGKSSLQLLYIFDFEHDRQPVPGSPWASPLVPSPAQNPNVVLAPDRPDRNDFSDHEYGLRFDSSIGALTWGFIYFYAWDKNPVEHVVGTQLVGPDTVLRVRPRHERLHHVGLTADYATALSGVPLLGSVPAVFRAEALWTGGVRFADFGKRAAALGGADTDGTSTRDTLRAAIAAEFALPSNTTLIFQPSFYYTFDWKDTLGPGFGGGIGDRWTLIPLLFLSRPFTSTQDRLRAELTLFPTLSGPDRDGQGIKTKLRLIYQLSQYITTQFVVNGYDGGNDTDLYGQYDHWDNVGVELSYEF